MTNQQALTIYQSYVEAWNPASSEVHRKNILSEVFEENMEYLGPEYVGSTGETLQDIERFHKQSPAPISRSRTFRRTMKSPLLKWVLVLPDGKVTVKGHDCIRFSPEGKILSLLTFGPSSPKP